MKKMIRTFAFIFSLVFALSGCGGGGGGGATPPPPTEKPSLSFLQSIASTNTTSFGTEYFPGQANIWTLELDFTVVNDQFWQGQSLFVGGPTGEPFPSDQLYTDLTYSGPLMGALEGIKAAAVSDGHSMDILPITGNNSAFLNATVDSRLQQQILSLPTGTTISVRWTDKVDLYGSIFGYDPNYKVVVRRLDGTEIETLYNYNTSPLVTGAQTHSSAFTSLATPTTVVLSFEESSSTSWYAPSHVTIDSVSVKDKSGTEYMVNGGFESGLAPWSVSTPTEIQNITSGSRRIGGLDVKRSFYTVPNKLWARWVDVFENKTVSQITTTISYETVLSTIYGSAIIYSTPSTTNKALTSWDFLAQSNDFGLVFGDAASVEYVSDDGNGTGSDAIIVSYSITVPAGGRVSIVNFALMSGTATGLTATDATATATDIDTEAANIVNNFWSVTDVQYRTGMTQAQIDSVYNFPKP